MASSAFFSRASGPLALTAAFLAATPSCSRGSSGASQPPTPSGPLATVHFVGRFDTRESAGPRFAWPGSAIAATFDGTGIAAKLSDTGSNVFTVVVDGGAPRTVATSGPNRTYALAWGLPSGRHTVVLTKRSESFAGVVQFLGLLPEAGALVPSPEPSSRRIEFIGDSITCGYGVLGPDPHCHFTVETEDETAAYGALAAAALGASHTAIAYSGIGVLRNADGSTDRTMPERFGRALADDPGSVWAFAPPPPDAVVVTLGENDFQTGDPGPAFAPAYAAFLRTVRQRYPAAPILCLASPMLGGPMRAQMIAYLRDAVRELGDPKVTLVPLGDERLAFETQSPDDGWGCDYHPSRATMHKMADALVPAIRRATGW